MPLFKAYNSLIHLPQIQDMATKWQKVEFLTCAFSQTAHQEPNCSLIQLRPIQTILRSTYAEWVYITCNLSDFTPTAQKKQLYFLSWK